MPIVAQDCYVKYVEENDTPAQIEQKKQELASADEFSSIRVAFKLKCQCQAPYGAFPKLESQT